MIWLVFWGSWATPGRSWVGPGRSRALLGRSWRLLGRSWPVKGAQREAFWEPKRKQNRSENEVEIQERKSCLLEAIWVDLGSFWEPSGREKTKFSIGKRNISRKSTFSTRRGLQERSGRQKRRKKTPKGIPKRAPNRSKIASEK